MIIYNFSQIPTLLTPRDLSLHLYAKDESNEISVSHSLYNYLTTSKKKIDNNVLEWDHYKKVINPYEFIHTPPHTSGRAVAEYSAISRSFYKLIEIVVQYNLFENFSDKPLQSFHLAEGPGGFIEAMMYLRKNYYDKYHGMTLLSDSRNVPKWNKLKNKFKFSDYIAYEYGVSGNGDLLNAENFVECVKKYKNSMDFLTGDGGFDFSIDYEKQEIASTKLVLAQIIYALMTQKLGGNFVLKIFDIFYGSTIEILFLLTAFYRDVSVCKPKTSRFANSEKYIVCKDFIFSDTGPFFDTFYNILQKLEGNTDLNIRSILTYNVPFYFIKEIEELNCIFGKKQLNTIHSTLMMIQEQRNDKIDKLRKTNIDKCVQWCVKNNVPCNTYFKPHNIFKKDINKKNVITVYE